MSLPTTLSNIFERYKREASDSRIDKTQFIKDLNDLLFEMPITKPAEQLSRIYYVDGFHKYSLPDDFSEAIAIYSNQVKIIRYVSNFRFKLEYPQTAFTDQSDAGKRFLKVRNPFTSSNAPLVTECDSLTADGTWAATGSASDLSIDTNTKKSGGGSIKFTINGTGGVLTFTKSTVIDASGFTEKMRERFFMWLPVAPASIEIRVGNDSSNYFSHTVTKQATGEVFGTEDDNELEFAEEESTQTGTVDKENIDWFQFRFTFGSSVNNSNFRIDKIVLAKPEILEFEYYTKYRAITSGGVLQDKITENADTTDEPIIKDYSDYINTIVDGLVASFLKNKAPERAAIARREYLEKRTASGKVIGGVEFLRRKYPTRRATYKRIKTLPNLNRGRVRNRRFVS